MKFKCEKSLLIESINLVQKSVSNKNTGAINECFLLVCDSLGFKMISTDSEIGIKTEYISCQVEKPGQIALPAKFFSEIIRKLPEGIVSIDVKSGLIVIIKCKHSEFKIVGKNPDEFPVLPVVQKDSEFKLTHKLFKTLIKRTSFSMGIDESKPALLGALVELDKNSIAMVTCDTMRVSYAKASYSVSETSGNAIIPSKAINEIYKLLADDDDEFSFYIADKHVLFEFSNCTLVSRLIEGEFINYKNIFPQDFETSVTISSKEFEKALDRAVLVSFQENKKIPVKLTVDEGNMVILTGAETGNSYDELEIDINGKALEISFNPKFLLDAVQAIDDDSLIIELNSSLSPCVLRPTDDTDYKFLVLPLRLRN